MAWENAVGAVSGLISSIGGVAEGAEQNKLNREAFEYNKNLNATMMEREDNAVQRRAADLEAAGLSKTLAAGSAASAQHGESVQAPRLTKFDKFVQGLQIGQQITDIMSAGAKADLARAQAEGIRKENEVRDTQIKLNGQNLANLVISGDFDKLLYTYAAAHGFKMPTGNWWIGLLNRIADRVGKGPEGFARNGELSPKQEAEYIADLAAYGEDAGAIGAVKPHYGERVEIMSPEDVQDFIKPLDNLVPGMSSGGPWMDRRQAKAKLAFLTDKAIHPEKHNFVLAKNAEKLSSSDHPNYYNGIANFGSSGLFKKGWDAMENYVSTPDFWKMVENFFHELTELYPGFSLETLLQWLPSFAI